MIRVTNARTHNLKNVSLEIPYGQWLAVCGRSGSGKSSLALDTLFAEGQRRYLECLSPATRRMITLLDKADVDRIEGIPPAIAVEPKSGTPGRRTTVGNATDILEYLRILYAQVANVVCPICHTTVSRWNPDTIFSWIEQHSLQRRYLITFALQVNDDQSISAALTMARRNGFLRAIVNHELIHLDDPAVFNLFEDSPQTFQIFLVADRLSVGRTDRSRVCESIELAIQNGDGVCQVWMEVPATVSQESTASKQEKAPTEYSIRLDQRTYRQSLFTNRLICGTCSSVFPAVEPKLFSFGRKGSACKQCQGIGFQDLFFRLRCNGCGGQRLAPEALVFKFGQRNIAELASLTVEQLLDFFDQREGFPVQNPVLEALIAPILARLDYLIQVGLGYLTLDRPLLTLSEGEKQRVQLTTCLSSTLTNLLYILDEPSRGLHWVDVARLVAAIGKLNQRGNTVVVVDHRDDLLSAADRIIEIGPDAGAEGGALVFDGRPEQLTDADTHTADFFAGRRGRTTTADRRPPHRGRLDLVAASGNNLKEIDVHFPLRCLCVVSGVSGSGKSSLVKQTLYPAMLGYQKETSKRTVSAASLSVQSSPKSRSSKTTKQSPQPSSCSIEPLPFKEIRGVDRIDQVLLVDTQPIGRSGRSNPLTYIKAFDEVRQVFAETADAKQRRVKPGHFSFNVKGGRCEKCQGDGELSVDMQFLPDMHIRCDDCLGTRFKPTTLEIRYRGLNIAEVLRLTANEAFSFFRGQPKVQARIKALIDVGLGYLQIGQPANRLSGGEAQRLKLASYLNAPNKKTLFIMEEPTTGLHGADVVKLLDCFDSLLAVGHSIIVVEHNPLMIANADWVIDMGPEAGQRGGQVVAAGTPEQIVGNPQSVTGQWLARWLVMA